MKNIHGQVPNTGPKVVEVNKKHEGSDKELFNDIEKTVKHVQDQGRCTNSNETFKNQIDEKLQSLEKNICFNLESHMIYSIALDNDPILKLKIK
jgi:hypothetical protein